jgi:CBS domain-containing protein
MEIREVMTQGVEVVRPNETVKDAAKKMKQLNIGSLPVCNGNRLEGVITDRDIAVRLVAEGLSPAKTKIRAIMSSGVTCCFVDQSVEEAVTTMETHAIRRLPILNKEKELVGMLSLGDVSVRTAGSEDADLADEGLRKVSAPSEPIR